MAVKIREIAEKLNLSNLTPELESDMEMEVAHGHVSDLLSEVMNRAPEGSILVTIITHRNVVAVAIHAGLSAVIFPGGVVPGDELVKKAAEEKLFLFTTPMSGFDVTGRLYELGLRGTRD